MKLSIGFSPCPNDTFIFDSLVNGKLKMDGLELDVFMEDVQTLNNWGIEGRLDVSKISYGVFPLVTEQYSVLPAGGAMGKGVGPLLITASQETINVDNSVVAIPGINTTAHLLFSLAYPNATNKKFLLFSEIEDAVLNDEVDLGVIIHENRFTYSEKGLKKVVDLGDYWEKETGLPIPLGCIAMKRSIPVNVHQKLNSLIKESINLSYQNYPRISNYVREHSQEMSEQVMLQHIDLYVNEFSLDPGDTGRKAVAKLMEIYASIHGKQVAKRDLFSQPV
ncbi:MAG: 1,4-dihydroxy-6-naphthoate synthase [Chitinophagaceae bacterium]|nr:1,4-dihydroxy-6-naphthoate synthase [Chitinophagaceae bacterium]